MTIPGRAAWLALCATLCAIAGTTPAQVPAAGGSLIKGATERMTLEQQGTLPFHLHATLDAVSDTGRHSTGTLDEDWYNDRWSHQTVTIGDKTVQRWNLDGRTLFDDTSMEYGFTMRRLLAAFFSPFHDLDTRREPVRSGEVQLGGQPLDCILLAKQPSGYAGVGAQDRSFCFSAAGDLRIANEQFGFRTLYNTAAALGSRHIPTQINLIHNDVVVASLRVTELRVAPDLSPASFAVGQEEQRKLDAVRPRRVLALTPVQMFFHLRSIDAHLVPITAPELKSNRRFVMVRLLTSEDGALQDAEVLMRSDLGTQQQGLAVLRKTIYRRRTVDGVPVESEGVIALAAP